MPSKVEYYVSDDNLNFTLAGALDNTIPAQDYTTQIKIFDVSVKDISARYVKIIAYNFGKLPRMAPGRGQ